MRNIAGVFLCSLLLVPCAVAKDPSSQPSNGDQQSEFGTHMKHIVGPKSVGMAAAGAGINQLNNTPSEWKQGGVGFGRRFGSAIGKHIVHKAIQYPIAKLLHEEFGYRRSDKQGFGPRLKYALVGTIMTHKTTTGDRTVNVSEISGAVGSGLISRLWQPASTRSVGLGFMSAGITIGMDAGMNVTREFWPEIRHPRSHRAKANTVQGSEESGD